MFYFFVHIPFQSVKLFYKVDAPKKLIAVAILCALTSVIPCLLTWSREKLEYLERYQMVLLPFSTHFPFTKVLHWLKKATLIWSTFFFGYFVWFFFFPFCSQWTVCASLAVTADRWAKSALSHRFNFFSTSSKCLKKKQKNPKIIRVAGAQWRNLFSRYKKLITNSYLPHFCLHWLSKKNNNTIDVNLFNLFICKSHASSDQRTKTGSRCKQCQPQRGCKEQH